MRRDWPRSAKPVCAPSAQHADAADALSELRVGGEARLWGISGIDVVDVSLSHGSAGESALLHATVRSGARRSGSVLVRKLATFGGISKAQDQPTAMCSPSKAQQQHVSNMRPPTT